MNKVAYLTMDSLEGFECYDTLTFSAMSELGWIVSEVSWRSDTVWNKFEYVVVRSPWDYQNHAQEFMAVLKKIDNSSAVLLNPLSIIEWNINKHYLINLQKNGVKIVPSIWCEHLTEYNVKQAYNHFETNELIIKPAVSAGANDTYRIPKQYIGDFYYEHLSKFNKRQCLIQPFMPAIVEEGEFSLFYFNSILSHCILKTPQTDDFRVQEEHGGRLKSIEAPEQSLLDSARITLKQIPERLLYARLDFVRHNDGFVLMEAELIEPSLYFNLDSKSPERFAKAFVNFTETL